MLFPFGTTIPCDQETLSGIRRFGRISRHRFAVVYWLDVVTGNRLRTFTFGELRTSGNQQIESVHCFGVSAVRPDHVSSDDVSAFRVVPDCHYSECQITDRHATEEDPAKRNPSDRESARRNAANRDTTACDAADRDQSSRRVTNRNDSTCPSPFFSLGSIGSAGDGQQWPAYQFGRSGIANSVPRPFRSAQPNARETQAVANRKLTHSACELKTVASATIDRGKRQDGSLCVCASRCTERRDGEQFPQKMRVGLTE